MRREHNPTAAPPGELSEKPAVRTVIKRWAGDVLWTAAEYSSGDRDSGQLLVTRWSPVGHCCCFVVSAVANDFILLTNLHVSLIVNLLVGLVAENICLVVHDLSHGLDKLKWFSSTVTWQKTCRKSIVKRSSFFKLSD